MGSDAEEKLAASLLYICAYDHVCVHVHLSWERKTGTVSGEFGTSYFITLKGAVCLVCVFFRHAILVR